MQKDLDKVKTRLFLFFVMELFGILFGILIPFIEITPELKTIISIYEFLCGSVFLSSIIPLCNLLTDLTKKTED